MDVKCPSCEGKGFYLAREGHGYYHDGSFGHNDWRDCVNCYGDGTVWEGSRAHVTPKPNPPTKG